MQRRIVVLPEPLRPRSATRSPAESERSKLSTTRRRAELAAEPLDHEDALATPTPRLVRERRQDSADRMSTDAMSS